MDHPHHFGIAFALWWCIGASGAAGRQELKQRFFLEVDEAEKERSRQWERSFQKHGMPVQQEPQAGQPLAAILNFMKKQDGLPPAEGA